MYWELCIGKYHLSGFLSCRKMNRIPSTHCLWCNKKEWQNIKKSRPCLYIPSKMKSFSRDYSRSEKELYHHLTIFHL